MPSGTRAPLLAVIAALAVVAFVGVSVALTASAAGTSAATATPTAQPTPTEDPGFIWGDLDCNRLVEVSDLTIGLEALAFADETTPAGACEPNGDLDCNGVFNGVDLLAIVRFVVNLPMEFAGCPPVGQQQFLLSAECPNVGDPSDLPDGGSTSFVFTFNESRQILALAICVNIDHPLVGDLKLTLKHDDTGTAVTLVDRVGKPAHMGNCTGHDEGLYVVFSDSAAETLQRQCTNVATSEFLGGFKSEDSLSAFVGEDIHGTWTLTVADEKTPNGGKFVGSTLTYIHNN